jgi:DNA-binding transcriptional MerR regulator
MVCRLRCSFHGRCSRSPQRPHTWESAPGRCVTYEELGLLTPSRTVGGHRLYGPSDIEVVERISRMQALGLSLATIRRILRYRLYQDESGRPTIALDDLHKIFDEARADAAAVQARIEMLRRELGEATLEAQSLERDVAFLEQRLVERTAQEQRGSDH